MTTETYPMPSFEFACAVASMHKDRGLAVVKVHRDGSIWYVSF